MTRAAATIVDALTAQVRRRPDAIALTGPDETVTYGQLGRLVDDGARRLAAAGAGHGDRVMILGENSLAWVVGYLATLRAGAVAVPVNDRLGAAQLPPLRERVEPSLVLLGRGSGDVLGAGTPPAVVRLGAGAHDALQDLAPAPASLRTPAPPRPHDSALIAFTSGTTGAPKGAVISHLALRESVHAWLPLTGADESWSTTVLVPLFHNTAYVDQLAQMLAVGGRVDVPGRYRTEEAVAAMVRRPPALLVMVPAMAIMLAEHHQAGAVFAACRFLAVGGAPMPASSSASLLRRFPHLRISHGYGLTEFTSLSHALAPELMAGAAGAVGLPVNGVTCSIRDASGEQLPDGQTGEVWLAGPARMTGYWRDEPATAPAFHGPWLRTGDRGRIDRQGLLWLHGRLNDTINRGGEKVSPQDVELVLTALPGVRQACVVGLDDAVLGQLIGAAVVADGTFDPAAARSAAAAHLPDYARPDCLVVLEQLPLAATGKLDRARTARLIRSAPDHETLRRKDN